MSDLNAVERNPLDDVALPSMEGREELQRLNTSLEWLRDLHYTIGREGVSQADMQAVGELRDSLTIDEEELPSVSSLEHYSVRSFTEERSSLNVRVAQEGIAATIIQTVKGWIRKVIEYIVRLIKWYHKTFEGDDAQQAKLDKVSRAIQRFRDDALTLTHKYVKPIPQTEKDIAEHKTRMLQDPSLDRNRLYLAAFGIQTEMQQVEGIAQDARLAMDSMVDLVLRLKAFLESPEIENVDLHNNAIGLLEQLSLRSQEIVIQSPKQNYLKDQLGSFDPFASPLRNVKVTPADPLADTYEALNKQLKTINRIANDQDVDGVVEVISSLTKGADEIARLAAFLSKYNKAKVNALRLLYKHESYRYTAYYQQSDKGQIIEAWVQEKIENFAEGTRKAIEDILR